MYKAVSHDFINVENSGAETAPSGSRKNPDECDAYGHMGIIFTIY